MGWKPLPDKRTASSSPSELPPATRQTDGLTTDRANNRSRRRNALANPGTIRIFRVANALSYIGDVLDDNAEKAAQDLNCARAKGPGKPEHRAKSGEGK